MEALSLLPRPVTVVVLTGILFLTHIRLDYLPHGLPDERKPQARVTGLLPK